MKITSWLSLAAIAGSGCGIDGALSTRSTTTAASAGGGDTGPGGTGATGGGGPLPVLTRCDAPGGYGCLESTPDAAPCEEGERACFFRVLWREDLCPEAAGCRLTVLFAGGEAGCDAPLSAKGYGKTGIFWADNRFVFVCAQPFLSDSQTNAQPYTEELPRIQALMSWVMDYPNVKSRIDPERVSVQGISHGGYDVALNYIQGNDDGRPTHLVVFDGGGDIGRTERTLWEQYLVTGDAGQRALHDRFVERINGAIPTTHPSDGFPFCAGYDDAMDDRYRRDSTDWACTSDPGYVGTTWGCADIVTTAKWRFYGCDDQGKLGSVDLPDREVECTAASIAGCPGLEATYVEFPDFGAFGIPCGHATCVTWACAAPAACEWITGAPCDG